MKLCDLETSKALQELGYDGECRRWYSYDGKQKSTNLVDDDIPAPRLDDAAYWLREKKGLVAVIQPTAYGEYWVASLWDVYNLANLMDECNNHGDYDTALENTVKKAIKIIKRTKL